MTTNLFEELHPRELKKFLKQGIIYLPLGTLEWHDEHLPFGTDAFESYAICKAACKRTGGCIIPPLYFGTDRVHKIGTKVLHGMDARAGNVLPGNIYFLNERLFYQLIKSIAQNVATQGFKKLVLVSAHAGLAQVRTITKIAQEGIKGLNISVFHGKNFPIPLDHAGELETSLSMATHENLVLLERLPRPYKGFLKSDPHNASKKKGREIFNSIVEQIVSEVKKK